MNTKLTEWNPFRDLDTVSPFGFFDNSNMPKVDVYQTNANVVVNAELPGVNKKDLNVYVTENSIQISGERKKNTDYSDDNIYRNERYYGTFYRTIALPTEIKTDSVKAEYTDGVLSVVAPKTDDADYKKRKINID